MSGKQFFMTDAKSVKFNDSKKTANPDILEQKEVLPKKKTKFEEIMDNVGLALPKCNLDVVNERILVIEVDPSEQKTESGILIPNKMQEGRSGAMKNIMRYFVVGFDPTIPNERIRNKLTIGIEVFPFIQHAEALELPFVIDPINGQRFCSLHYTELCSISPNQPEFLEK